MWQDVFVLNSNLRYSGHCITFILSVWLQGKKLFKGGAAKISWWIWDELAVILWTDGSFQPVSEQKHSQPQILGVLSSSFFFQMYCTIRLLRDTLDTLSCSRIQLPEGSSILWFNVFTFNIASGKPQDSSLWRLHQPDIQLLQDTVMNHPLLKCYCGKWRSKCRCPHSGWG